MNTEFARLKELFDAAIELPTVEQRAFVEANTPDDPTLRQELLDILAGRADSGFLGHQATPPRPRTAPRPSDELPPGTQIGSYRILRVLGGGGMGIVYLAVRNDDVFRKTVALKIIRTGVANVEFVERFRRERQILAGLDHPNIARILDGGDTDDGRPFYVMEYVDGQPLDEYCRRVDADVEAKVRLAIQVCEAIEYLHEHAVVHRDVKPGNVLVTSDGRAKLLDFGIAGIQTAEGLIDSPAAGKRTHLLTPGFASPEQLEGQPASKTSDIYSLGILLYYLLCGTFPFVDAEGEPNLARQLIGDEPTAPSRVGAKKKTGSTRAFPDLDRVVLTAIRREPARRYSTVRALREDLQRVLEGRPVTAHADTWTYRIGKAVRRNKALTALGAALVIALAAVTWLGVRSLLADWEAKRNEEEFTRLLAAYSREISAWQAPGNAATPEEKVVTVRRVRDLLDSPTLKRATARPDPSAFADRAVAAVERVLAQADQQSGGIVVIRKEVVIGFQAVGDFRRASRTLLGGDDEAAVRTYERAVEIVLQVKRQDEVWATTALTALNGRMGRGNPVRGPDTTPNGPNAPPVVTTPLPPAPPAAGWQRFPTARFEMGCRPTASRPCQADATPVHTVTVSAFDMMAHRVTRAEFERFAQHNAEARGAVLADNGSGLAMGVGSEVAAAYCASIGARLPTEAEWELAARVGCRGCGLTSGDAWEWTGDWYAEAYYRTSPGRDPKGPATGLSRVLRGGPRSGRPDADPLSQRGTRRKRIDVDEVAFRCVAPPK